MGRKVVITGMEIVSSIGNGLENFWVNAKNGACGIKTISSFDPVDYSTKIAGEVELPCIENMTSLANDLRFTSRSPKVVKYALFCAASALKRAKIQDSFRSEMGTFIGTSLGGLPEQEHAYQLFFTNGWRKVPALTVLKGMPNSIANNLAITFGLRGMNYTFSNACVSSADAIVQAYEHIKNGKISAVLCGGTESLIWPSSIAAWCKLKVLSTENDNPKKSCKPFAADRKGMVMADGAAFLVLEEYDHAKARGAKILAEVAGCGNSCDAYHVTAPSTDGQIRAINSALRDANCNYKDIDHISAHGTGTMLNDLTETQTIKAVFQERAYSIPITAQKSMTGHSIGAAAAMEIIASVLSIQNNILLPTINLDQPDPQCDLDYVANKSRNFEINTVLSNHFAFGGSNVAIILKRI